MIRENVYITLPYFYSHFLFHIYSNKLISDASNFFLRSFYSFWLSLADKVTTGTYNFVSLIIKMILLELASLLSTSAANKTQYFVHLSFNSTFKLINDISSNLHKLLKYFNCTAIVSLFRTPLFPSALKFPNNFKI